MNREHLELQSGDIEFTGDIVLGEFIHFPISITSEISSLLERDGVPLAEGSVLEADLWQSPCLEHLDPCLYYHLTAPDGREHRGRYPSRESGLYLGPDCMGRLQVKAETLCFNKLGCTLDALRERIRRRDDEDMDTRQPMYPVEALNLML